MTSKNASCSCTNGFWILKISPQNQSLETVPVCIVLQCCPHNNIVCTHMCDECKISSDSVVCHRPWSISWSIVQVSSLTREYQVFQYVSSTSISEQFESILWQFSHGFQFFFFEMMAVNAWSWYFVELLCRLVCQLTTSLHTFLGMTLHIVGPRRDSNIFRAW